MAEIPDPRTGDRANDIMLKSRDPCIFVGLESCVMELARAHSMASFIPRSDPAYRIMTLDRALEVIEPIVDASTSLTQQELAHFAALYARAYNGED